MTTIGKDLEKIRMAVGLTIEDVHHATKISVSILLSIENGSIFEDKNIANTYVRSYVRSYGRALKIDDELLIKALDQQETGNYNQLLLESFKSAGKESSKGTFTLDTLQTEEEKPEPGTLEKDKSAAMDRPPTSVQGDKKDSDSEIHSEPEAKSSVNAAERTRKRIEEKDVDWADMGQKFHPARKRLPAWPFLLGALLIAITVAAYFIFLTIQSNQADERETNELLQTPLPSVQDLSSGSEEYSQDIELDDVLYITIYAAYGQLDPVRVWSDTKPRLDPYWIEQGTAMTFEFQDLIRIRGQYSNFLVFKNGHLIDEPRVHHFSESENAVEISRELFTQDSRWAVTIPFELPGDVALPDTVVSRPVFN
ncbi:MAG: hypothetical protein EA360_05060 [Balneolaceae bacterium]|nr:MAG: hypothetical protein EA360_05060 [Balneolaceae bacterium]